MKKLTKTLIAGCLAVISFPIVAQAAPSGMTNQEYDSNQVTLSQNQTANEQVSSAQTSSVSSSTNTEKEGDDQAKTSNSIEDSVLTFAQPFQNTNTTLSGKNVRSTTYFTKVDYWNVKKATFNLTYMVSQLSNDQESTITLTVNGVKFYSFKPAKNGEQQTVTAEIPTNLLQTSNVLTIEGQIINKDQTQQSKSTPANWLTICDGSNVNFSYTVNQPENKISSFYTHFIGEDTVANNESVILVPKNASNKELTAATYALTGVSRLVNASNSKVQMNSLNNKEYNKRLYQIVIANYKNLPEKYKKEVSADKVADGNAYIKFINNDKQKILLVTAKDNDTLVNAGRYIANQELMQQTTTDTKTVSQSTQTFTADTQTNGYFPLTSDGSKLTGSGHQEQVFFISLPHDQTNSKGSYVNLNFRYADNLDFKTSLVTVYVNDKPIGSKHLSSANANGDHFRIKIPNDTNLDNSLTIRVSFDLNLKDNNSNNSQTPWAYIENDSDVFIKTAENQNLLFSNYPSCFINNQSFNQIGVQLPEKMNDTYYKALSNIFSLIGNYAENNTGEITFYRHEMSDAQMRNHNVIVLGTPKDTPLIKKLNDKLFFKFNKKFTRLVSNEKLSIESSYGKRIGSVQLLFNPYNKNNATLVVTGATPKTVELASTQIDTQAHAKVLKGDGAVINDNGQQYTFRFKKKVNNVQKVSIMKRIKSNPGFLALMGISALFIILMLSTIFLLLRKNKLRGGK